MTDIISGNHQTIKYDQKLLLIIIVSNVTWMIIT